MDFCTSADLCKLTVLSCEVGLFNHLGLTCPVQVLGHWETTVGLSDTNSSTSVLECGPVAITLFRAPGPPALP